MGWLRHGSFTSHLHRAALLCAAVVAAAFLASCGGRGSVAVETVPAVQQGFGLPLEPNLRAGDVILSDGTKVPAAGVRDITVDQIAVAVGVVYDPSGRRMVGLRQGRNLQWAPVSSPGYSMRFKQSKDDGSLNWAVVQRRRKSGWNVDSYYPAFNFAQSYRASGLYADGWYLPAVNELKTLYGARAAVGESLERVTGEPLEPGWYWSSTMKKGASSYAYYIGAEEGFPVRANKGVRTLVLAVHSF